MMEEKRVPGVHFLLSYGVDLSEVKELFSDVVKHFDVSFSEDRKPDLELVDIVIAVSKKCDRYTMEYPLSQAVQMSLDASKVVFYHVFGFYSTDMIRLIRVNGLNVDYGEDWIGGFTRIKFDNQVMSIYGFVENFHPLKLKLPRKQRPKSGESILDIFNDPDLN